MKKNLLYISIIILGLLFFILSSILIVTREKAIYSYGISMFNLENDIGLSSKEMELNYSYVVDYILGKKEVEEFQLPTLEFSKDGSIHFYEVKKLINLTKLLSISLFIGILILIILYRSTFKSFNVIQGLGFISIIAPLFLLIIINFNFNFFFNIFHEILFNNEKWLFNPVTDPIIKILPQQFFLLCGTLVFILTVFMGCITLLMYKVFLYKKSIDKYIHISHKV